MSKRDNEDRILFNSEDHFVWKFLHPCTSEFVIDTGETLRKFGNGAQRRNEANAEMIEGLPASVLVPAQ